MHFPPKQPSNTPPGLYAYVVLTTALGSPTYETDRAFDLDHALDIYNDFCNGHGTPACGSLLYPYTDDLYDNPRKAWGLFDRKPLDPVKRIGRDAGGTPVIQDARR